MQLRRYAVIYLMVWQPKCLHNLRPWLIVLLFAYAEQVLLIGYLAYIFNSVLCINTIKFFAIICEFLNKNSI